LALFFRRSGKEAGCEETAADALRRYGMVPGRVHVVEEPSPEFSLDAFVNIISASGTGGARPAGLVVSRMHPDQIRQRHGLETTPIYWLAARAGDDVISPNNLGILTHTIVRFVEEHPGCVVLLEGLEYLVSNNEFIKVLRVINQLNDLISQTGSVLILPVDTRAFSSREVALLERNTERVLPGRAR